MPHCRSETGVAFLPTICRKALMTEKEMRSIVQRVLSGAARTMVIPATLGIGLSLSGCEGRSPMVDKDGKVPADADTVDRAVYAAPFPDAVYAAPFPDAGVNLDWTPQPTHTTPLLDSGAPLPTPLYMAPQPKYAVPLPKKDQRK